jgi:hypothetical protein
MESNKIDNRILVFGGLREKWLGGEKGSYLGKIKSYLALVRGARQDSKIRRIGRFAFQRLNGRNIPQRTYIVTDAKSGEIQESNEYLPQWDIKILKIGDYSVSIFSHKYWKYIRNLCQNNTI